MQNSGNEAIFGIQRPFGLGKDQVDHPDRYCVAELLVANVALGVEFEALGKAHGAPAFLGMQTAWYAIDEIHTGLGSNASTESGQSYGVPLYAVYALALTSLGNGTHTEWTQFSFGG